MFSVVIPLYNKAHTIEKTIYSVLNQSYQSFEIVIIDDGSTDNGPDIIRTITNDNRIRIINQENQGVSAARNKGVACSRFDYIAFLDGDDEWDYRFLAKMKEAIDKFPRGGMFGSSSIHRNMVTGDGLESTIRRYKGKILEVDYFENPHTMPHTSAVVISKKIFNSVAESGEGFPVGMHCCEDWCCFYRIAFVASTIYVGFPLGIRNFNVAGQVTASDNQDNFKFLKSIIDFYNITYGCWERTPAKSRTYMIFMKYEIRGRIICSLRENDYRSINYMLNNLNEKILAHFPDFEFWLYKEQYLKLFSKFYIYLTKLLWRTHRFPVMAFYK